MSIDQSFTKFANEFGIPAESRPRLKQVYSDQYHEALGKANNGQEKTRRKGKQKASEESREEEPAAEETGDES